MQPELELKIHSDISAALETNLDASDIEIKHAPDVVFIGRNNYKKFLISASISLCFTHFFLFMWSMIYLSQPKRFSNFFLNYKGVGNGYDIAAVLALSGSLAALAGSRRVARSQLKFFLIGVINLSVAYLSAFLFIIGRKKRYQFADYLHLWYAAFYCGSLGLFINALIGTKLFLPARGVSISAGIFLIIHAWLVFYVKQISPYFWEQLLFVLLAVSISGYYNFSAHTMLQRRFDYYLNSDWALGYGHLQIYFLYHLWHDWLFLKKGKPRDFNLTAENYIPEKSEFVSQ